MTRQKWCIVQLNFKTAFQRGSIDSSRKRVLSCGCSKNGTITIDYWADAPCEAHVLAGKTISSVEEVNAMLTIGSNVAGIGVGSCQWSGGRRVGILNKYKTLSDFSAGSLLLADVSFIMDELGGSYSYVISECDGLSASDCARKICTKYERPAGGSTAADTRAAIASDLGAKLAQIGK